MKTPKHSLRKIVSFLNEPDEEGGFWLPNIQRVSGVVMSSSVDQTAIKVAAFSWT